MPVPVPARAARSLMVATGATSSAASAGVGAGVDAALLAAQHGLHPVGRRPSLRRYFRRLWDSRHFLWKLSYLRYRADHHEDLLGAGWNILRPLLQAGVYSLIFGVILNVTKGGTAHKIAFITTGVFVFSFTSTSVIGGAKSVTGNLNLVRALPFPRAVLPLSSVLVEAMGTIPAYIALCCVGLATGHHASLAWFALAPMMVLQTLFNCGTVFVVSRVTVHLRDFAQVLPFLVRIWFYTSGVFFAITDQGNINRHQALKTLLEVNPTHLFIDITRKAIMEARFDSAGTWLLATGWAVGMMVVGFVFFWHAEETYGRD